VGQGLSSPSRGTEYVRKTGPYGGLASARETDEGEKSLKEIARKSLLQPSIKN